MLIDWFTVGAQAVNFIVLVWLLKRYLYRPILDAVDAREKRIAAELADADAKKTEALKERNEFQQKNEQIDQQRTTMLKKATDEAKAQGHQLLDEARKTADALAVKRQESLQNDLRNLNQEVRRRTQKEVFAIARQALTDLAAESLEDRMTEAFVRRLGIMDAKTSGSLGEALRTASEPAVIRTAFELPEAQRTVIAKALNERLSTELKFQFVTAPDIVSGIELTANGQKIAWSIGDYLTSLEKGIDEVLTVTDKAVAKKAPKPKAEPQRTTIKASRKSKPLTRGAKAR